MILDNPSKALNSFRKEYPDLIVDSVKDYGSDYLITAYKSKYDPNPFYLVSKNGKWIRSYSILADMDKFYNTKDINIKPYLSGIDVK